MSSISRFGSDTGHEAELQALADATRLLRPDTVGPLVGAIEIAALTLASMVAGLVYHAVVFEGWSDPVPFGVMGFIQGSLYVAMLKPHGFYRVERLVGSVRTLRRPLVTWMFVFLFFSAVVFAFKVGSNFSRGAVFWFFVLGLFTIAAVRTIAGGMVRRAIAAGRLPGRRLVVVGDLGRWSSVDAAEPFANQGARVMASFPLPADEDGQMSIEDGLNHALREVVRFARIRPVDEIILALPWQNDRIVKQALEQVRVLPLPVYLLPEPAVCELLRQPIVRFGGICAAEMQRGPLSNVERSLKRVFDIIVSLAALFALAPMLGAVALMIKADSPGPIFFRQTRVGFSGRQFRIFKFRSMTTLDDGTVVRQATRNDVRVTRVGRFLRASSIDELPQLINVLLGHMSLVGPRPHALAHDDQYEKLIATYAYRHHVKPGITGWAQVNGLRGETPTVDLMERRVEHDLWYIANWSFWLDIRTIIMTVTELMKNRNAY